MAEHLQTLKHKNKVDERRTQMRKKITITTFSDLAVLILKRPGLALKRAGFKWFSKEPFNEVSYKYLINF